MVGNADSPEARGIIPNSFAHIFGHIAKAKENEKLVKKILNFIKKKPKIIFIYLDSWYV